jgi:glucose-1-phosphate thymidylyltransferase
MKALILAGGSGSRLRPITYTSSKQLVPVANKPILFYAIEHMAQAGIIDIGMIVGDTAAEVREAVGSGERWGVHVTYIQQDSPAGLAHAVLIAHEFLGDDDFVMYLGDNLLRQGVKDFVDEFVRARAGVGGAVRPDAQILLAKVPDPHRFGVAELDVDGRVLRLVEKPKEPASDLALVGVYMFDSTIHEAVRALKPSARGELEITEAIQWLIDNGRRVNAHLVEGYWKDLGELDAFLDGNSLLLEGLETRIEGNVDDNSRLDGRVVIEAGAVLVNSTVRGPAVIGRNVKLTNSYVGPFSAIGDGCELVDSEIEHSVIMERSKLIDVGRIEDSLIGRNVKLTRSQRRPRATRLMIGDSSTIDFSWG